jgi:flagellar basal body-associated protein FliL
MLIVLMVSMSVLGARLKNFKQTINENISFEKWGSQRTLIEVPGGITYLDGHLYVTDKEAGKIVVLDKNGIFLRQSTSNNLKLIEPTTIKTDGELLYVLDSGDTRLKILTKDFELVKSMYYSFSEKASKMLYWDLEVIEGKIYVTSFSMLEEEAVFYQYDESAENVKHFASDGFLGYLSTFNGQLMAVNSLEFTIFKTQDGTVFPVKSAFSGKNSLFKVNGFYGFKPEDQLKEEFGFVDGYIPLDFLLLDNYIYVFSGATASLDKYSIDGQYIETVLNLDDTGLFVQMTSYDNVILIANPQKRSIYKVFLGEEELEEKVVFIEEGSQVPFILKGGRDVVVVDLLNLSLGSDDCRREVNFRRDEIKSALQDLFLGKTTIELSTPAGLEKLNREIRDLVNRITGFYGERGREGVIEVFYHITALTSVE